MSRSGTSLTARVLNLAGVYLGSDEELLGGDLRHLSGEGEAVLARAREANPDGFFEHYRLMRLNERLLRALGGNWREPPTLSAGWEGSDAVATEREEALALLEESFGGHPLWGWKDPRNSLTLPFWQSLVPEMRYVICLRNPLDVAASLKRRDGMPVEQGLELFRIYITAALARTAGRPRLLVRYEDFFADRVGTAQCLARFVGCDGALDSGEGQARLAEAVDERLWRNRTPASELGRDERLPDAVASVYLEATQLAADEAANAR
jgi:hypothetical protein